MKQRRQDAARAADEKKETPKYPSQAELTAEADEDAPQTLLTISDAAGKVVRRLSAPGTRGIHRFVWNLRGVAPTAQGGGFGGGGGGGADQADQDPPTFQGGVGGGSLVPPGTYKASLSRRAGGVLTRWARSRRSWSRPTRPRRSRRPTRAAALDYQEKVARFQRSFAGASEQATQMKARTTAIRRALVDSPAEVKMLDEAVSLDRRVDRGRAAVAGRRDAARARVGLALVDSIAGQLRGGGYAQPLGRADGDAADELHDCRRAVGGRSREAEGAGGRAEGVRAETRGGGRSVHGGARAGPVGWSVPRTASHSRMTPR